MRPRTTQGPTAARRALEPMRRPQRPPSAGGSDTSARTPHPGPEMKPRGFGGDAGAGCQGPRGARAGEQGRGRRWLLARGACRELIRPPARNRHRNHSTAPAPGARGNGPASHPA